MDTVGVRVGGEDLGRVEFGVEDELVRLQDCVDNVVEHGRFDHLELVAQRVKAVAEVLATPGRGVDPHRGVLIEAIEEGLVDETRRWDPHTDRLLSRLADLVPPDVDARGREDLRGQLVAMRKLAWRLGWLHRSIDPLDGLKIGRTTVLHGATAQYVDPRLRPGTRQVRAIANAPTICADRREPTRL